MLDYKIQDSLRMNFFKQNRYTYIYIKDKTITKFPKLEIRCITCSYYIENIHPWAVNMASTTPKWEPKHTTRKPIITCSFWDATIDQLIDLKMYLKNAMFAPFFKGILNATSKQKSNIVRS